MPTERHSYDKKFNFIKRFTKYHGFTKEEYRKKYISPLRKYLDIVEQNLCNKSWNTIDYSKVPSCAMHKL
jgi:hypothetical protein